jgi:hypothetical protein
LVSQHGGDSINETRDGERSGFARKPFVQNFDASPGQFHGEKILAASVPATFVNENPI